MRIKIFIILLFLVLISSAKTYANEDIVQVSDIEISPSNYNFALHEVKVVMLKKNQKFYAKPSCPISNELSLKQKIKFTIPHKMRLFRDNRLSTVQFNGSVTNVSPPKAFGRSSSVKLKIDSVKIDNITYPTTANITKIGNKSIFLGNLCGSGAYLSNLAYTYKNGTITIDKIYKNPCEYSCSCNSPVIKPIYYLAGGLLQISDIMISPVVSAFKSGSNLYIPASTIFEIKLQEDVPLLEF